ncbi:MAG: SDR family oxidoreductase [Caldilineaceae bacterium]
MRLQDRVAVVTGGGSGIGRAICLRFASGRARPSWPLTGGSPRPGDGGADRSGRRRGAGRARRRLPEADVAALADAASARFGTVDILVNNAAISDGDDVRTIGVDQWDRNLAIVLKSVFLCTKAVLPGMIEQRRGSVVNIASVNGQAALGGEPYSAAKAGVINLTKNLAIKYGQYGVRANAIAPGTVQTPIWQARVAQVPDIFERLAAWYPLGRVGQPEDIANAALFLASDEASWITGTVLNVDGGLMAGMYRMRQELEGE